MKNLFKRTTIKHEVLEKIREVNSRGISSDTKRYIVSAWLENYYKAEDGRKKDSKELIQRLSEIEKDRGFNEMIWAAFVGFLFSAVLQLITNPTSLGVYFLAVVILAIVFLVWGIIKVSNAYSELNEYDQMHLENEEKELIESILKERFEKAHNDCAVKKVRVRKEPPTNDQKIELIKVYHEEWRFRQEHVWKKLVRFVVIIFFASTMPITIGLFPGVEIPEKLPLYLFPVLGIILTTFFLISSLADSARIKTVDTLIRKIVEDVFPAGYNKNGLVPLLNDRKKKRRWNPLDMRMGVWIPVLISAIEIAIAIGVIVLIYSGGI